MTLIQFLKDPWSYIGAIGTSLMLAVDWISTHASPMIGLVGAIMGLIMLVMGIHEKIKKNRLLDKEIRLKDEEYRQLTRNQ